MKELLQSLEEAADLAEIQNLIGRILQQTRDGQGTAKELRLFLRHLVFNSYLNDELSTSRALDYLFANIDQAQWNEYFGKAVEKELPSLAADLVDNLSDVSHQQLLRFLPDRDPKVLIAVIKQLNAYLEKGTESTRCLRGMRSARIMSDIYHLLGTDENIWKRRTPPPSCIDNETIQRLKEEKQIDQLPQAYETRINQLQRRDLRHSLATLDKGDTSAPQMTQKDYGKTFEVRAPLRLGISSANASDNHIRSKEQGGKTLNAGIELQMEGENEPTSPLKVVARRLNEPQLILRSRSMDFKADFEVSAKGDAVTQSELFFAYRRGGDEALRLVKQALVHTGIVNTKSQDVLSDITAFTGGGGLEITTRSKILQGSGLGTSSILAAAILKVLYRLANHPLSTAEHEYPGLYDQSLLLEQSIGLNSGWQDARGAYGGPGAIKNFYAPPTEGLPAPQLTFLTGLDEKYFAERVLLFDTGISRAATRGLNVVMDAYLCRDPQRYAAMRESLDIHDRMVEALSAADYALLGKLATRYWQLRCIMDPDATNPALQQLFEAAEITKVIEGGLLTGAGGGGFALLIAKEDKILEAKKTLDALRKKPEYARSGVVEYQLNASGIQLSE